MSDGSGTLAKRIFLICGSMFLLLQAYGIYYAKLRLQFEASSDIMWFSGPGYSTPMYRYAFILNKFLLFPGFWLHLSARSLGILYCLNDAFFYLIVASLIILLTKRYDYAATILAAPVLIHGTNFYWIVNEIYLSGSLLIFFAAILTYMRSSILKTALLISSIFFIIWSHPLMILALLVFLPFIYTPFISIKKHSPILLFIVCNIMLRLLFLSSYDHEKLGHISCNWNNLKNSMSISPDYLFEYAYVIIGVVIATHLILRSNHKAQFTGLIFGPFLVIVCILCHLPPNDPYISKYLYPVSLFLLLQSMIFLCAMDIKNYRLISIGLLMTMGISIIHLIRVCHPYMARRADIIEKLNTLCSRQQQGQSKWFIKSSALDSIDGNGSDWYTESLFFSAIDQQYPTIQLVRVCGADSAKIHGMPCNTIFIHENITLPIKSLDTNYFKVNPGPYKELILDADKVAYLKK